MRRDTMTLEVRKHRSSMNQKTSLVRTVVGNARHGPMHSKR